MRKHRNLLLVGLFSLLALSAGCAGGGSSTGPSANVPASTGTSITGVASKGIIDGGDVKIYAPPASGDIAGKILLATTKTSSTGRYTADLGSYSGIVLVEVSGSYKDEATGASRSIAPDAPLRAVTVVGSSGGTVPVSVTPMTELATRKALNGSVLTPSSVQAANALVSNLFHLDVVATEPVKPETTFFNAGTLDQRNYTLALAGVSELASHGSLGSVLNGWYQDLATTNRLSASSTSGFQAGIDTFLSDINHNNTGTTTKPGGVADIGKFTGVLHLVTQGSSTAPITSIQLTLTLPAGVVIKKDASGTPMVAVSGLADKAAAPGVNNLSPNTLILAIISSPGFGIGEFATITYVADPGVVPVAGDFLFPTSRITGFDGANDFDIAATVAAVLP